MKKQIFVAASYSSKVDYDTGEVFPEYREWLESQLAILEAQGHEVFCALRADNYKINDVDPAGAYRLDMAELDKADILLALLNEKVSAGVQTEIGYAIAKGKEVLLAVSDDVEIGWFNKSMELAGVVRVVSLPLADNRLASI